MLLTTSQLRAVAKLSVDGRTGPPTRVRGREGVARLPTSARGVLGAIVEREGPELLVP